MKTLKQPSSIAMLSQNSTKRLPAIADWLTTLPWTLIALLVLLAIAALSHAYNMFGFPMYLGDEGIYVAQAYAVAKLGKVAPYTYWYDHSPVGWLQIALWSTLTGGFHTFGTAIDSGRVFMLLLHLGTVAALFYVIRLLTRSTLIAIAMGLFYTLSPLAIVIGRQVLLDNIMIFWMLLATVFLLRHQGKVIPLLYSGVCFGIAVLSKENGVLLLPAFTYSLWVLIRKQANLRFVRTAWLFAAFSTISTYLVFAALRKELLPLPFLSSGNPNSVTLFSAIFWQGKRAGGAPWETSSMFYKILTSEWLVSDRWLLLSGVAATLWCLVFGDAFKRFAGLLSLFMVLSIARGGPVLSFYVAPVLPLFALNLGLFIHDLSRFGHGAMGRCVDRLSALRQKTQDVLAASGVLLPQLLAMVVVGAIAWGSLNQQQVIFTLNITHIQHQALAWIRENVQPTANLVIDDDLWVDLQDGGPGQPKFPNAHSHWKVAGDPEIYRELLKEDWRKIDYLVLTPGLAEGIFAKQPDKLPYQAYQHSQTAARFNVGGAVVEIRQVNGDRA